MNDRSHAEDYRGEEGTPRMTTLVAATPKMPAMSGANALVQRTLGEVQVAVMMAKQFPRDKIAAKEKLTTDCCREGLAAKATYTYNRGGTEIVGPTIRFAEAAKNAWGNLQSGYRELTRSVGHDGVGVSEIEAFAWDTENNTRESTVFIVRHWRDTKKGGYALKDERDIRELLSNQAKRVERTCILNSIDGDIIEDGLKQCETTLTTNVKVTPERLENMLKSFAEFGVSKDQIEKRIQRRYDAINPPLLISLTKIFNSIKDGMSKAEEWFEPIETDDKDKPKATGNDGVAETLKKKKAKAAGADQETGEIKTQETKQPENEQEKPGSNSESQFSVKQIPIRGKPDNGTEPDYDSWYNHFAGMVQLAPDGDSLMKLQLNNNKILQQMETRDPDCFKDCMEIMQSKDDFFKKAP